MKKILLIFWVLFFTTNSFCDAIFKDSRAEKIWGLIYYSKYDEAIQLLNDNVFINFSIAFQNLGINIKEQTLLNHIMENFESYFWDRFFEGNVLKFPFYSDKVKNCVELFKLLIDRNEFSDNINIYHFLKRRVLPCVFMKCIRDPYEFVKLFVNIYKMIKDKLKLDIEAAKFGRELIVNKNELNCFPMELKAIIGNYLMLENIPADLYDDLLNNEIETMFDLISCEKDGYCSITQFLSKENKKLNEHECCTIL